MIEQSRIIIKFTFQTKKSVWEEMLPTTGWSSTHSPCSFNAGHHLLRKRNYTHSISSLKTVSNYLQLKSSNIQYSTLGCWVYGTKKSAWEEMLPTTGWSSTHWPYTFNAGQVLEKGNYNYGILSLKTKNTIRCMHTILTRSWLETFHFSD